MSHIRTFNLQRSADFEHNKFLQLLLRTTHLLSPPNESNDELAGLCITEINKSVFHGMHNLLNVIIKYIYFFLKDKEKLQQIFDIIKNITLSHNIIDENNNDNDDHSVSMFHQLSMESISNICSYLDRKDIESFKLVSNDIAIVCLQRMTKYSFGIYNINKSIQLSSLYVNILKINDPKLMNYDVYHATNTMYDLSKHWENIYHIPTNYQLLYNYDTSKFVVMSHQIITKEEDITTLSHPSNIEFIGKQQIKQLSVVRKRKYILFDTRNIVIISDKNNKPKRMNDINQTVLNEMKMHLLQYFDIFTQKLYCLQMIAIDKNTKVQTVIDYVKCEFITTYIQQKQLYDKIQNDMKLNDLQLIMYKRSNPNYYGNVPKLESHQICPYDDEILTLQLSYNDKMSDLKDEHESNDEIFCKNVTFFIDTLSNKDVVTIKYVHHLSMLKAKMKALCNNNNNNEMNIDFLCDNIFRVNIEICRGATYGNMRKKISEKINGIISHQNIELYEETEKYLHTLSWYGIFNRFHGNIFFDLVSDKIDKTKYKEFYEDAPIKTYGIINTLESLPGLSPKQIAILTNKHNTTNNNVSVETNKSQTKISILSQLFSRKTSKNKENNSNQSNHNENNKKLMEEKNNNDQLSIKTMNEQKNDGNDETNYFIKIYESKQYPFFVYESGSDHHNNTNIKTSFIMKYCYKLIVNDTFLNHIINEISKPIYSDSFKDILYLLKQNKNVNNDHNHISYELRVGKEIYHKNQTFEATNHPLRVNKISLILYNTL